MAVAGALLLLLGVVGVPAAILGAIDPVEAQLSNDPDPFGTPRSSASYLVMAGAYSVAAVLGFFMVRWGKRLGVAAQQAVPADVARPAGERRG